MADAEISLHWEQALRFRGGSAGGPVTLIDGEAQAASSPMQLLLLALAGCTAADMVVILDKMRLPLGSLEVRVEADRAADPPRRYTRIHTEYRVGGIGPEKEAQVRQALELSLEKYCSVLHTLRQDTRFTTGLILA
jgi:putative redox protein